MKNIPAIIPESDLLTVSEVARQLRVTSDCVRGWIEQEALEAITLPHKGKRCMYRVRRSTLTALLNEQQVPA